MDAAESLQTAVAQMVQAHTRKLYLPLEVWLEDVADIDAEASTLVARSVLQWAIEEVVHSVLKYVYLVDVVVNILPCDASAIVDFGASVSDVESSKGTGLALLVTFSASVFTPTDDELPSEAIFDLVASAFEADLLVGTGFQVKLWQCRVAAAVHLGCMDAAQHYPARACCVAQDTVRQLAVAQGSPSLADCTLNVVAFQHKFEV